jgi:CubicO group peptidase (beta-lactamase class C family)
MSRLLVAVACAVVLAGGVGAAQRRPAWTLQVDALFKEWDRKESPGCAAAIYRDGRIVHERGYGMADLEQGIPITPATVFYAGSVSKQFTAFAAALAIQQGRLGLDDPIRKHLPELPAHADAITVRHLVHHTSGLRDFYTLLSIAGRRQDSLFDNDAILRLAARQRGLNFPPGHDYLYSNTGYALLATIVGRAAGSSFAAFTRQHIFEPLGMRATRFGDDAAALVKQRAHGYTWGPRGEPRLDTPGGERVGAGGLFTTVRDLLRWDENFYSGDVGGKALIAQIETPGTLANGEPLAYAWGLQVATYRGLDVIEHSGALGGYRAQLTRFPRQHVSVALLCNLAVITPAVIVRQIADLVLADRFTEPKAAPPRAAAGAGAGQPTPSKPDAADAGRTAAAVGLYSSDEVDATFAITANGGQLLLQRDADAAPEPLQPTADGRYRFRGMTLRFVAGADGQADTLLVDAGRVRDIAFTRRQ